MGKVTGIDSPGRRRTKVSKLSGFDPQLAGEQATVVYGLLLSGKSPSEIAEELGIAHTADVFRTVAERFQLDANHLTNDERDSLLALEVLRLNALQSAYWKEAMLGDVVSARFVLDIIRTRTKITGLEQVDPVVQKNLVLVMGEKEDEYIAALKAASTD